MTLYKQILSLPLFQGLSYDDIIEITAHTKFGFMKKEAGSVIVRSGDVCDHLYTLLKGEMTAVGHADDNRYAVEETFSPSKTFELESLFGLDQRYTRTFTARTDCNLLVLDKREIMTLSDKYLIVRMNILNRLATDVQKFKRAMRQAVPIGTEAKIQRFIRQHCSYPAGHKILYVKMQTLADEISESRLKVSAVLNNWAAQGLIRLSRSTIEIPKLETLFQLKVNG